MITKAILGSIAMLLIIQSSFVFAGETQVGGEVYPFFTTDITNNGHGKGFNKFDLSRVYLTVKSKLSQQVSVRITADVDAMDGTMRELYLKYAYLDWDVSRVIPYSTIRFGLQQTGWIDYMNKVWGRRYVAKTLLDEYKVLSSADYGISDVVKLPNGYGHGSIQILQGPGYKGQEENRYKDFSAFVFLRPLVRVPDLAASIVGAYAYKGYSDQPDINSDNKKDRVAGLLSLACGGIFRASGEYFMSWDRVHPGDTKDLKMDGVSVFGDLRFPMAHSAFLQQVALVGRYDLFDPNKDVKNNQKTYIIAGAEWTVTDGFSLMPNFQRKKTKDQDAADMLVLNALYAF
jgi:hypothetical protein